MMTGIEMMVRSIWVVILVYKKNDLYLFMHIIPSMLLKLFDPLQSTIINWSIIPLWQGRHVEDAGESVQRKTLRETHRVN